MGKRKTTRDKVQDSAEEVATEEQQETAEIHQEDTKDEAVAVEAEQDELERLREELERAESDAAEYYDRYLRLAADFENYKKRIAREVAHRVQEANGGLMSKLVPVLDNFERALNHSEEETDFESFRKGVEMIFEQMKAVLEKEGLVPIDAVGQPFDPNLHEAMMQMESEEYETGTVMEEVEKGYKLNDRVLRHSKVTVSK